MKKDNIILLVEGHLKSKEEVKCINTKWKRKIFKSFSLFLPFTPVERRKDRNSFHPQKYELDALYVPGIALYTCLVTMKSSSLLFSILYPSDGFWARVEVGKGNK